MYWDIWPFPPPFGCHWPGILSILFYNPEYFVDIQIINAKFNIIVIKRFFAGKNFKWKLFCKLNNTFASCSRIITRKQLLAVITNHDYNTLQAQPQRLKFSKRAIFCCLFGLMNTKYGEGWGCVEKRKYFKIQHITATWISPSLWGS